MFDSTGHLVQLFWMGHNVIKLPICKLIAIFLSKCLSSHPHTVNIHLIESSLTQISRQFHLASWVRCLFKAPSLSHPPIERALEATTLYELVNSKQVSQTDPIRLPVPHPQILLGRPKVTPFILKGVLSLLIHLFFPPYPHHLGHRMAYNRLKQ